MTDAGRVEAAERDGATPADALALFDTLPPAPLDAVSGTWAGGGLHTGHPLDGALEAAGWYGKRFEDAETVFPLLFHGARGPIAIDPRHLPFGLAARLRPHRSRIAAATFRFGKGVIATRRPSARLRELLHREVRTTAMIYDAQPVIDVFRMAAPDLMLGLMDARGLPPLFFTLRRT